MVLFVVAPPASSPSTGVIVRVNKVTKIIGLKIHEYLF
jgi:hypothetical protein